MSEEDVIKEILDGHIEATGLEILTFKTENLLKKVDIKEDSAPEGEVIAWSP